VLALNDRESFARARPAEQADAIPPGQIPVRKILMGVAPGSAANRAAMANPKSLDYFIEYALTQSDYSRS
jgi:hypothetical protein